jgi:hypothetical protein
MQFKSIPWWLWLLPVALLVIATARLPYGYYTFTRFVICGSAAFIAFISWQDSPAARVWSVLFALMAILFNPIFPIYLKLGTWFYLDLGCALIFAAHLALVRLQWLQTKPS